MSSLVATDRVQILLTLVPYLLERGEVSVTDAAAEFGVTTDQMRRMVEKLTVIGLPGEGGFWQQPHELFDINWDLLDERGIIEITQAVGLRRAPRLTTREAAALLAGLRLATAIPGVADTDAVRSLIAKLSGSAAAAPGEVVVTPPRVDEVRALVSRALRDRVAVRFSYRAPDAPETTRTVDPASIAIANGEWYLQGWCHTRRAMRTFNLERVSDAELTDIPAEHAGEAVPDLFDRGDEGDVVVVRFRAAHTALVGEYIERAELTADGEFVTARILAADARTLKRLATLRGGLVEIVSPTSARRAAGGWAAAGLEQYEAQDAL